MCFIGCFDLFMDSKEANFSMSVLSDYYNRDTTIDRNYVIQADLKPTVLPAITPWQQSPLLHYKNSLHSSNTFLKYLNT